MDKYTIMRKGKKLGEKEWVSPRGQGALARMPRGGDPAHHFPRCSGFPPSDAANSSGPRARPGI